MKLHLLNELDEPKASLRILLTISKSPEGIISKNIYETMNELGVGRTAVDTSLKALLKAGLIVEYPPNNKRYNIKIVNLTTSGETIVTKLTEIIELMEKGSKRAH